MSRLINTYTWNKRVYWNVDVDGYRIEIKNAKDAATAISLAESIVASRKKEIEDAPLNAIKEAFSVLISADLSNVDAKSKADLTAKLSGTVVPKDIEPVMDEA
jgi:hypothetical protein